ncbi:Transcriptional regulator SlyA [wastewater metagenome]|uniref:Transcriptional regulator SlyA n=2 Tax=unclassified sequences TaxID=12908 RepID=A0A5B8RFW8_9ZZZZ|nr:MULTISPECIES: MarR family transcriptional regulator [Arhodomonas]MCS4502646.1 MarR family transcriptional regulator [Arhodomonas aquaeolei]QEA07521.1 transcriptional regulator SlyA [uncultured organism]
MTRSPQTDAADIDHLGLMLAETAQQWRQALDTRLRPLGLSQAKWRTLMNISRGGEGLTQRELAARTGIEPPTVVRLLDRLAADGWIERKACSDDRRRNRIYLTERAHRALDQIMSVAATLRDEMVEGLDETELRTTVTVLERLRERAATITESERERD